jgi:hypothetical protein
MVSGVFAVFAGFRSASATQPDAAMEDWGEVPRKTTPMPDLAAHLLRRSLGAPAPVEDRCGGCQRTPLVGERLHELDSGRVLCELCFGALPEERRLAVRSERVHVSGRRLSVARKAA